MSHRCKIAVWLGLGLLLIPAHAGAEQKLVIHEWGTFTSLQDELGNAIGGINTDDEPVPKFVHRLANFLLLQPTEIPPIFFQGAPSCHPDVTMRLETPVIYFYPPESQKQIQVANIQVKFRGGWLTEFYPDAHPDAPGFKDYESRSGPARLFQFGPLRPNTESKLTWANLEIGGDWTLANTTEHVWTSPRAVQAASVRANGESEKFLFYRGVAHIDAPLNISRDTNTGQLVFRGNLDMPADKPLVIPKLWLVDIQSSGKIAFRPLPSLTLQPGPTKFLTRTPSSFQRNDFASGNLDKLKSALQEALVAEGLFSDEAQALLNTWELSYFKSAGLRVFFIVPREWTDFFLPLDISVPAIINRVMVGRIELVTPEQRAGLQKLAGYRAHEIKGQAGQMWTNFYAMAGTPRFNQEWKLLESGSKRLADSVSVPKSYQTYLNLGRFRNALILNEARSRPSEGLTNFISTYRLQAYEPSETAPVRPAN